MSTIFHHIANATGELDMLEGMINAAVERAKPIVEKELGADKIDIIFVSAANLAMPEFGIGGNSPGPNHVYVSFDPTSDKITQKGIEETLLHEIHHCMRWRNPGYGETLGEAMVTEGLACLYEEEHSGQTPLYASVDLKNDQIEEAKKALRSKDYDHGQWFFGNGLIDRWFGYTYGYIACKAYATVHHKNASELVHVSADEIINFNR